MTPIADAGAYRGWLERFLDGPEVTTLVFGHGGVVTGASTERLRALAAERLG